MKKYRTIEQLEDIADNCNNGNWSDAAKLAVEGGFYANDFINMDAENLFAEGYKDIAILCEMAQKERR